MPQPLKIAGFALLLASCSVATPGWVKPGAGPTEFASDKTYCDNRSDAASSARFSAGIVGQGAFNDCMRARGWTLRDNGTPPPRP